MTRAGERRAIVTLSIGERPFFPDVLPSMRSYADRVSAKLVVNQFSELTTEHWRLLAPAPNLPMKSSAQLLKLFSVRDALQEFDRVLLLDDSCYVSRNCPDIFVAGDRSRLGCVEDGGVLGADESFRRMINTGVLLFEQPQRRFLDDLESLMPTCKTWIPDQILVNEAIEAGTIQPLYLPWRFNVVGSQLRDIDQLDASPWIHHLTSGLSPVERSDLARRLREHDA